jgi:DNA topoisomerase-2
MVENPAFDSQTKDTLTTKVQNFGSKCQVSDSFLKKIAGSPIVDSVISNLEARANAQLKRALGTGGKKK